MYGLPNQRIDLVQASCRDYEALLGGSSGDLSAFAFDRNLFR